jgi:hypothetical protein
MAGCEIANRVAAACRGVARARATACASPIDMRTALMLRAGTVRSTWVSYRASLRLLISKTRLPEASETSATPLPWSFEV